MRVFRQKLWLVTVFAFGLLFAGCDGGELESSASEESDEKIKVLTTIAQIGEPLSVIGGDRLEVESLMGPSVDPHLYNPTQSDIAKVDDAEIIFYNGLNLEVNMVPVFDSIGKSKPVLAIGEAISQERILNDEDGAIDPHIWFDIDLWEAALDAAVEELKAYSPEDADFFEENKLAYFSELEKLREEANQLSDIPDSKRILVTAHDAFGYFGNTHDIEVIGLQGLSTEDEIGISDINEIIALIKEHRVPAIFIESSINSSAIEAVIEGAQSEGVEVELGGELYSDAMGSPGTDEGTYIGMYRHNIQTIYEALMGE
ncbi:zinc ABC transporter substrate-binding protein [Oceanobacillus luteolus]|uniref:Metal ABC transporter solute-binding protein, Zn/Mn family n=1 Tax=Oceanobacillus luteolus TaxID=1274358 RepID=A0ABW4HL40_9BACI|nr:zinc ABC transporter substrate-binding protein [Oceanobacillus luteolus]MCM3742092.1 zinc ABC transporter substrate-binding protein [Oceanobacillus luteolus]